MLFLMGALGWMSPSQFLVRVCVGVCVCVFVHMCACVFPHSRQTVFVPCLFFLFLHFEKIFGIEYFPSVFGNITKLRISSTEG